MTDDATGVLQRQIAELQRQLAALQSTKSADDTVSTTNGTIDNAGALHGVAVGVNYGRIIYGRDASEDERRRLGWYLQGLSAKLAPLPLRGIDQRLGGGAGVELPHVYVMLAVTSALEVARGEGAAIQGYFIDENPEHALKPEYDPNRALPDQAIVHVEPVNAEQKAPARVLRRAQLAAEATKQQRNLVLLGDPGGGKSTFVRHLAWALAQRALTQPSAPTLPGWNAAHAPLPVILPLRTLAARLARDRVNEPTVYAALRDELHACCTHQIDDALSAALANGSALLLFDGLDEVPPDGAPGVADRVTTLCAVREIARRYPSCTTLLTCRTRAFDENLRAELGWHVETLAPFTLGQIRHFTAAWYGELVAKQQIDHAQAQRLTSTLLAAITDRARPRLRAMAETPLLLTLMALVLFNKGELPRDRPQLYERVLDLLLGQWDQVREGHSFGQAIGQPRWDSSYIRPLLDRLSYEAHRDAASTDGRGQLARGAVYTALIDYLLQLKVERPGDTTLACLDYFEQRSGLLLPDGPDSFVFAHLTLQEHCAGRQIVLGSDDPVALVLRHRSEDRWREPIMLGMGLAAPLVLDRLLSDLIEREEAGSEKPIARWYRDLILAAEIGADRDWIYLRTQPQVRVDRLQRELRRGLVALLADRAQPLPVAERVRAGFLLGDLGDPRYPVTLDDWRREVAKIEQGDTSDYFCRVEAGTYTIGSADDDPDAQDEEKPQHQVTFEMPFWIARYPITNEQWQQWVSDGGGKISHRANDADFNQCNQPVVGIAWASCYHFCTWLRKQLSVELRLPTEFEGEAAARGEEARRYPWGQEWIEDRAATEEDREKRGSRTTVPIGCYPAGAAGCQALDMLGNVWEWTASVWQSYPGANKPITDETLRMFRGGAYWNNRTYVRCGARSRNFRNVRLFDLGFRIVVAPRPH